MLARARRLLSDQLSRPTGRLGRVVAALMNRGNRGLNDRAIALLDVRPGARVLDLGFGGGLTFDPLLAKGATVIGVDRATDMVEAARRDDDRLRIMAGEATAIPLGDGEVDRVLTVNTVYFWPDLHAAFEEIRRVLAPSGRLVIAIRDGAVMTKVDPAVFTLRTPEDIRAALERAGFGQAEVHSAADGATHLLTGVRAPSP